MTIPQTFGGFGLSPEEQSPEPTHSQYDDDVNDVNDVEDVKPASGSSRKGQNPRKGPAAADKRATHNAIERARRENLNGRFMTLAEALPSMGKVKRPSKSVIVNKALEFVYEAQVKEHALVKENNELRREVDQLRRQLGLPPLPPPAPLTAADSAAKTSAAPRRDSNSSSNATNSPPNVVQQSPSSSTFPSPPSTVSVTEQQSPALPVNVSGMFHNMTFPPTATTVEGCSPVDAEEFRQQQLAALFPGQSFMAAAPSPAQIHAHAQAQAQAQAQAMLQAQLGYMNPAFLSAAQQQHHHHSMLLAAHQAAVQQQQQQQQQQQPQYAHVPAAQQLSPASQQQQPSPSPSSLGGISGQSPTALSPIDMYNALGSSPMGASSMPPAVATTNLSSWGSFTSTTSEGFSVFA